MNFLHKCDTSNFTIKIVQSDQKQALCFILSNKMHWHFLIAFSYTLKHKQSVDGSQSVHVWKMKPTPLPFTLAPVIRKGGTCSTSANTSSVVSCLKNNIDMREFCWRAAISQSSAIWSAGAERTYTDADLNSPDLYVCVR